LIWIFLFVSSRNRKEANEKEETRRIRRQRGKQREAGLLVALVHRLDESGVLFSHHLSLEFQGRAKLATANREVLGKNFELLNFLSVRGGTLVPLDNGLLNVLEHQGIL